MLKHAFLRSHAYYSIYIAIHRPLLHILPAIAFEIQPVQPSATCRDTVGSILDVEFLSEHEAVCSSDVVAKSAIDKAVMVRKEV